ncbi:hypothetical protein EV426DRAFT_605807 [Tirmania nivea]|nr:hypothetical protein EV426DRAFT_605807 [Tirmania nivea]
MDPALHRTDQINVVCILFLFFRGGSPMVTCRLVDFHRNVQDSDVCMSELKYQLVGCIKHSMTSDEVRNEVQDESTQPFFLLP